MITDPIADMLTRIRNALLRKRDVVVVPLSKIKLSIVDVLKKEGYIAGYEFSQENDKGSIVIQLKYVEGQTPLHSLRRISKPGVRRYVNRENIPYVMYGMGISILSTSQGVMTGHQAKRLGIGGELLCIIS